MQTTGADLVARAARVLGGGATHVARSYTPAIHVVRATGSRKWLVDGRELVDYTMGHGALLLGHAHPAIVAAVREQVERGTHYGACNPLEVEWAELVVEMVPSARQVRFTSSGTEATMLALRLARAATGREVVAKLDDHFHGWHDAVSVNLGPHGVPLPPAGVAAAVAGLTRVVRDGDAAALREALADRRVAALMLEPSGAHYGRVPLDPALVREARRVCDETGTLLVFDEVVTGFRVAPGGMQHVLGVRPDLSAFGKVLAGGLPGGAVGGGPEVMGLLGGGDGVAPRVVHPGTFNANPLSAAAGITMLALVRDGGPQERAAAFAGRLEAGWRGALAEAGVAGRVWRLSSIVHVALDDPAADAALSAAMRAAGVDLLRASAFCSAVHDDDDLEQSVSAMGTAARVAAGGR